MGVGISPNPTNLQTIPVFTQHVPLSGLSEFAMDLFALAVSVYVADLRVPRQSAYDQWTRDLHLHLRVSSPDQWDQTAVGLSGLLSYLTGDRWVVTIDGTRKSVLDENAPPAEENEVDAVCLLSGGLDSFTGAIDLLSEGAQVLLVGHYRKGYAREIQLQLYHLMKGAFDDALVRASFHYLDPPVKVTGFTEPTTRSRSLLFISLAVLEASRIGPQIPIFIPENGFVSLNVPLTRSRVGSVTTRTTHPFFLGELSKVLELLGLPSSLKNPYRFKTKGEMLAECADIPLLDSGTPVTISCAHPTVGRWIGDGRAMNCGNCLPCIVRRSALRAVGKDTGLYRNDLKESPPLPGSGAGSDLRAFQLALEELGSLSHREIVARVLSTGPLGRNSSDISAYVSVYERGMAEIRHFIEG